MAREEWLRDEDLTPCSNCDKPFTHPLLHIVDINLGIVDQRAVRERVGLTTMLGSAEIARVMGAYGDGVVRINTDERLKTRLLLCVECFSSDLNLAVIREKLSAAKEQVTP